jgi:hypothetical protein
MILDTYYHESLDIKIHDYHYNYELFNESSSLHSIHESDDLFGPRSPEERISESALLSDAHQK